MIPLPSNVTPEKTPPMPRQSRVPPVPALSFPKVSPAGGPANFPMPRLAGGVGIPSMQLPQGNQQAADMGRVEDLLEQLVKAQRKPMEQPEPSPLDGPVQETGWQTLFNGQPLDRDRRGNSILRRR